MTLVCVYVTYELPEAVVIDGLLQAHGLHPHLQNARMAAMKPILLVALGGIRVLVPEAEGDDAQSLIGEPHTQMRPMTPESDGFWTAPLRNGLFGFGVLFFAGIPAPIWRLPQQPESSDGA